MYHNVTESTPMYHNVTESTPMYHNVTVSTPDPSNHGSFAKLAYFAHFVYNKIKRIWLVKLPCFTTPTVALSAVRFLFTND